MKEIDRSYYGGLPEELLPFTEIPELLRLKDVGMNCGCEYTAFPLFKDLPYNSRYDHSLGTASIVWHFTKDLKQSLAALFHDIATPVFAHSIDFLYGDYENQEATEEGTEEILRESAEITGLLEDLHITVDEVKDYHLYPIADNDSPRLSADRLEYTLSNFQAFGICSLEEAKACYEDLSVSISPEGKEELSFRDHKKGLLFGLNTLKCSRVYVSDEDRYSMQILSELIGKGISLGILTKRDLYTTEQAVIRKLLSHPETKKDWEAFRSMSEMLKEEEILAGKERVIPAKKRCIDPLVIDEGRLSENDPLFRKELDAFLNISFGKKLSAR